MMNLFTTTTTTTSFIVPMAILMMMMSLTSQSTAFIVPTPLTTTVTTASTNSLLFMAVELVPEPEGGEELSQIASTMENAKMKKMKELSDIANDDGPVYSFWLQAEAKSPVIKEVYDRVLRDAKKKANFPGFRKGQVPPYALPQIRGFAVQEGIIRTVEAAVKAYGLKSITGAEGEVEVLEDVPEIAKGYKDGNDVQFTCTLNAVFDPSVSASATAAATDGDDDNNIIDAEVVKEE